MKKLWLFCAVLMLTAMMGFSAFAQELITKKDAINGKMSIKFNSRVQVDEKGRPAKGVQDNYTLSFVVADTTVFKGTVLNQPSLFESFVGLEVQPGWVKYLVDVGVRNPKDLTQEKTIGKLVGIVPINKNGEYLYDNGDVRMAIDPVGKAAAFESKLGGLVQGKKTQTESAVEKIKKNTLVLTRMVGGKTVTLKVDDYDPMVYKGATIPSGPALIYPEARLNGDMVFDYARSAWYFHQMSISYMADGKEVVDMITGNIKWSEDPNRKANGLGQYDLNVRFNEEKDKKESKTEAAAFAGMDDEAAFFATDNTVPSMTGTIKYKDRMKGETVTASEVVYNLDANKLTKIQILNLFKLLCLVNIIPMNSE